MRTTRLVAAAVVLSTLLVSAGASANASGLAGYTGKPTAIAPQGESCNQCHSGGTAPSVALNGPATLAAGTVATYTFVITTGQSRAAAAIAATDGVVLTPVSGVRDSFGEMVPNGGEATSGGGASFTFKVTAPLTGSTLRLWMVGLAANGSGTGGDKATHLVRDITVTGGAPAKPDAGSPPPSSSSSSGGADDTDAGADGTGDTTPGESSGGSKTGTSSDTSATSPGGSGDDDSADDGTGSHSSRSKLGSTGSSSGCSMGILTAPEQTATGAITLLFGVMMFLRNRGRRS